MSNWLGFSLSPHLRVDEDFGREDQAASFSVMPLLSDGSLCVADPFRRPSNGTPEWRYENTMDEGRISEDGPKLEDFLGCYSNSPSDETEVHCQQEDHHINQNHAHRINANLAPSFNTTKDIETGKNSLTSHSSFIQSYHFNDNAQTLIPSDSLQHCDPNPSHSHSNSHNHNQETGMYHVPFESASSFSGFKSWLRQTSTPFSSSGESPNEASNCNFQSLSLTVSPSSQNGLVAISPLQVVDNSTRPVAKSLAKEPVSRKSIETFGQRTSQYRGVTRHRWTGRYEAHLWDNSCRKEGQTRKGRQGGYDKEEKAARAYDLAALKYWGPTTHINFPVGTYEKELEEMERMTRQEFVANLRRRSSGFSRGASVYRGVTRYDVRRICSSSTLIASDLAKRSSKDSTPTTLEDYNSCASSSSISPQPLLAIAGCEASDELPDMVWSANTGESQQQQSVNSNSNDSTLMASSSRNSSNAASPKCSVGLISDFGHGGGSYS
ncbi:hypothetical protein D5086_001523 [Populus alba]|uniref:Uncharacterized protein n=1 Tax=Populus alba TaxID=43335 RepID=A0ACC4D070_POPAL